VYSESGLQWGLVRADQVYKAVLSQKESGKAKWWQGLDVVLTTKDKNKFKSCYLKCRGCKTLLSVSNPSNTARDHFKPGNCSGYEEGVRGGWISKSDVCMVECQSGMLRGMQVHAGPCNGEVMMREHGCHVFTQGAGGQRGRRGHRGPL
jgi:hypothetical protein